MLSFKFCIICRICFMQSCNKNYDAALTRSSYLHKYTSVQFDHYIDHDMYCGRCCCMEVEQEGQQVMRRAVTR